MLLQRLGHESVFVLAGQHHKVPAVFWLQSIVDYRMDMDVLLLSLCQLITPSCRLLVRVKEHVVHFPLSLEYLLHLVLVASLAKTLDLFLI